jgi:hypothetical protein
VPPASENTRIGFLPAWNASASAMLACAERCSTWVLHLAFFRPACAPPAAAPGDLGDLVDAEMVKQDFERPVRHPQAADLIEQPIARRHRLAIEHRLAGAIDDRARALVAVVVS